MSRQHKTQSWIGSLLSFRVVALDPGVKNIGWAELRSDKSWSAGTLPPYSSFIDRMKALDEWCREHVAPADLSALEIFAGHASLIQSLAAVQAVVAIHVKPGTKLAIIHPSTHFAYVGGKGVRTARYHERCEQFSGLSLNEHEATAVACVLTALADHLGRLPERLRGKVRWQRSQI